MFTMFGKTKEDAAIQSCFTTSSVSPYDCISGTPAPEAQTYSDTEKVKKACFPMQQVGDTASQLWKNKSARHCKSRDVKNVRQPMITCQHDTQQHLALLWVLCSLIPFIIFNLFIFSLRCLGERLMPEAASSVDITAETFIFCSQPSK